MGGGGDLVMLEVLLLSRGALKQRRGTVPSRKPVVRISTATGSLMNFIFPMDMSVEGGESLPDDTGIGLPIDPCGPYWAPY